MANFRLPLGICLPLLSNNMTSCSREEVERERAGVGGRAAGGAGGEGGGGRRAAKGSGSLHARCPWFGVPRAPMPAEGNWR
jgi:hypothetical protein